MPQPNRALPVTTMIGSVVLAAWKPFWMFMSSLSTFDFMRTAGGHPSIGAFFLPTGVADGLTVVGLGVIIYYLILIGRKWPKDAPLAPPTQAASVVSRSIPTRAGLLAAPFERVTIHLGDYRESHWQPWDNLRIEVKDIRRELNPNSQIEAAVPQPCAHLKIEIGGFVICGGTRTKHVSVNEYLVFVPLVAIDREYLIWHAYFTEQLFSFFAIRARHINEHDRWIELELCLHRPIGLG